MNTVMEQKLAKAGELTRTDIAEVLASIAKPGEKRAEKQATIKQLCETKNTGRSMDGHGIWDTLADWSQF
jgi:hypothetical protein